MPQQELGLVVSDRPSRADLMMEIAQLVARRGTCQRAQVGCVVTNREMTQIFGFGYNGNHRGGPNTCDRDEAGHCGCIHAEVNALLKSPYLPGELILFTTTSPCVECAKLILNAGISIVYYATTYRNGGGILLLSTNGVSVWRHNGQAEAEV